jgi:WD40 repeat protein
LLIAASFSPDGRWILTVNRDDPPRLWEWQRSSAASAFELTGDNDSAGLASFSRDSTQLALSGSGNAARVWQVATGRELYLLEHDEAVTAASFSADGRWIATTSVDGTAILWDAASGKRLMELGRLEQPQTANAFSPDGSRIVTGTATGDVLIYPCEICAPTADLLQLARSRVTRALTAAERVKYLDAAK